MINNNIKLNVLGYKVRPIVANRFVASNATFVIMFDAELKGKQDGLYYRIISVYDVCSNCTYKAQRYHRRHISTIREIAWQLELNNALWNYDEGRPVARQDISIHYGR